MSKTPQKSRFSNGLLGQWVQFRRNSIGDKLKGEIAHIDGGKVVIITEDSIIYVRPIEDLVVVIPTEQPQTLPSKPSVSDEKLRQVILSGRRSERLMFSKKPSPIIQELKELRELEVTTGHRTLWGKRIPQDITLPNLHLLESVWEKLPFNCYNTIEDSREWNKLPNDKGHHGKPEITVEIMEGETPIVYHWCAVIYRGVKP